MRSNGTPDDLACFHRSIIEGFFAVAGSRPVTAAHVATSVQLARDAGMANVAPMETLGALLVRYVEVAPPPPPDDAPDPATLPAVRVTPVVRTNVTRAASSPAANRLPSFDELPTEAASEVDADLAFASAPLIDLSAAPAAVEVVAELAAAAAPAPAPAAPAPAAPVSDAPRLNLSFRSEPVEPAPLASYADDAAEIRDQPVAAADAADAAAEPSPSGSPRSSRRTQMIGAAGVLVALVGVGIAWTIHQRAPAEAPVVVDSPDRIHHLGGIDLDARFPEGWHVAPDPDPQHAALGAHVTTAMVFRGGTAPDPDQAVFLAALPLADELAAGSDIDNTELLHATHNAELGAAARVAAEGGHYRTEGCKVSKIAHTAMCRGAAKQAGQAIALRTYLRVGAKRAVVALFTAKPTVTDAIKDAEAIVASFGL